ncbi:MAG: hypothetical protein FWB91_01790 [Defluviitaleaceae bacterium]|nr:hypothetical protein [Defluviitaleaceae bacterium]
MNFDDALYEVLQTSRYDRLTGRSVDFRQVFMEWLERALVWLLSRLNFAFPEGSEINTGVVATVFVVVGALIVGVAGVLLARTFLRSRVVEEYDLHDIFEELADKKYTVADLLNLSKNAENRRLAVRFKYIATLLALNERQTIRIKPSATNSIILKQIKASTPGLVASFIVVAEVFHRSWFGYKNITDEMFEKFISATDTLVSGPPLKRGGEHA